MRTSAETSDASVVPPASGPGPTLAPPLLGGRMPTLDGLRALAIAAVMAFHYLPGNHHLPGLAQLYWATHSGWLGVDLFFVLSGFLITGLLLEAKGRTRFFRDFYVRRVLRIFPLYYATLAIVFVLLAGLAVFRSPSFAQLRGEQLWLWAYAVNWVHALRGQLPFVSDEFEANHFWSLAVEEQFYLVWPLIVFLLTRRRVLGAAAGLFAASCLARALWLPPPLVLHVLRADGLLLGAAIAAALRTPGLAERVRRSAPAVLAGAALVLAALFVAREGIRADDPWVVRLGLAAFQLACGASIVTAVALRPGAVAHRVLASRPLEVIARYSYALYVVHWAFHPWYRRLATALLGPEWTRFSILDQLLHAAFFAALSFGIAAASYRWLELPFLRLKDVLAPSARGPATAPGTGRRSEPRRDPVSPAV